MFDPMPNFTIFCPGFETFPVQFSISHTGKNPNGIGQHNLPRPGGEGPKGLTTLSSFTSLRNSYQALDGLISHRLPLGYFRTGIHLLENGLDGVRKAIILPNSSGN